jgi:hypothetical protein
MPLYNPPSSTTIPDPFSRTTISASYISSSQLTASNISTNSFTFTSLNGNGSGLTGVTASYYSSSNLDIYYNQFADRNIIENKNKKDFYISVESGSLQFFAASGSDQSIFLSDTQNIGIVQQDGIGNVTSSLNFGYNNLYHLSSSQKFSYKSPENTIHNIVPCYKIFRLDTSANFTVNPNSGSLYFVKTTTSLTGSFTNGTIDGQELKVYNSGSNLFLLTSTGGNPDYTLTYTGWNLSQNECTTFVWDATDSKWRQID